MNRGGRFSIGLWIDLVVGMIVVGFLTGSTLAGPRALPAGELPDDARLAPLKDLDGYFPFVPSADAQAWSKRAEQVRRQILVAQGLWPMPTKTPLRPTIHGKIEQNDYTVEKVYFESVPGFFVTGNLYRPKNRTGKLPAVLSPHGHWDNGRFTDAGPTNIRNELVQGAERFEDGGRSPLQSRCVQLARMGCVVFHYDMIGYADSQQITEEIAHRFAKQRPEMSTTADWGLFSPQSEAHLQSVMGLQTWNSIRALDFLLELPDVDPARIAVTGASGGGTQTFILCAIDPRPTVAFPAVMVSTAMQGGCTCENASLLRIGTGNVEFAALFAPKPLGMTAANDWTREMPAKGFPELQKHYAMLGAPKDVMLKPLLHFGHNYNYVSRAALYSWINRHFKLGLAEPIVEEEYHRLSARELSVWDDEHSKPPGGPDFERGLLAWFTHDAEKKLEEASDSADNFRKATADAIDVLLGRTARDAGKVEFSCRSRADREKYTESVGLLRNVTYNEELPAVILHPKQWNHRSLIWLDPAGKAGLFADTNNPSELKPEIARLLNGGTSVIAVDLLFQGEFLKDGKPLEHTAKVQNPREAAAYTFGYNRSLFAQRVNDVLTAAAFLKQQQSKPEKIELAAFGTVGPIAAAARAQLGDTISRAALNTTGFRFGRLLEIHDPNFLPGGAKYGDVPGLLALAAPGRLWLAGEGETAPDLLRKIYAKAGALDQITMATGDVPQTRDAAVEWLLKSE